MKQSALQERRAQSLPGALDLLRECIAAWSGPATSPAFVAASSYLANAPSGAGNHFAEALVAVRGLVATWSVEARGELYERARTWSRRACRSCGVPARSNRLCSDCLELFWPIDAKTAAKPAAA